MPSILASQVGAARNQGGAVSRYPGFRYAAKLNLRMVAGIYPPPVYFAEGLLEVELHFAEFDIVKSPTAIGSRLKGNAVDP